MTNSNLNEILLESENIIYQYKPNKKRFIAYPLLITFLSFFIFVMCCLIISLLVFLFPGEGESKSNALPPLYVGLSFLGLMLLMMLLETFLFKRKYNNTFYAITNMRVLVRTGIFGITYSTLLLSSVASINVSTNWVDKLFKTNAGDVYFFSSSTPNSYAVNGNKLGSFAFISVEDPYKIYKEISSIVKSPK